MNDYKNNDFFPAVDEQDCHLVTPETHLAYRESDEDRRHEDFLDKFFAQIDEMLAEQSGASVEWGELPFDAKADEKRWNELAENFDRVSDESENQ